ncbi:DUF6851 domain-containing protein [Streptomyces sp. NBC_01483]|uniref:DUF6851 domain-containing protein n=1 Tax=Streptomyces sp. NBC_01483 TaxID=2903883 RepID=UPI002E33F09A|nr:hypothetical protein [Streptomyces sp. NBC_01483]
MATSGSSPAGFHFDFDNGNFYRDLIGAAGDSSGQHQAFGPKDVSIIIWIQAVMWSARFDALAPYHPTAVGVHSRIGRRPAAESATNRNKNIAALYASYQVANAVYPEREHVMRQMMTVLGLDPDDESEDPTTPVGIGNIAGKAAVGAHARDGMNFLGDEGRTYHARPYDDYTGYQPVNTAHELVNPSRWQPAVHPHRRRTGGGPGDKGVYFVQGFITPQLRLTKAYAYKDPGQFKLARPDHLDHTNPGKYKRSVDEILQASAGLTDEQKVKTEFFDNTYLSILQSTKAAGLAHQLDLDGWVHLLFTSSVAQLDSLIAAWHQKHEYDAVRPFSAIRHVYGSDRVTAWGGPGKGTVDDIPADEWAGYLPVGDGPEYPCGTTTLCAAEAQATRRFLGDDVLDWTHTVPAGSTLTEPGITPAEDVELHYATWTDFEKDCARSRVWASVHFRTTTERSLEFGAQFGDQAYAFVQRHIDGDVQD